MDWRNRFDQIKNKVKNQLNARGIDTLVQLKGIFYDFDKDQSGTLSKLEFEEFVGKIGIFLTKQELRTVYDQFDMNKDGQIQYEEFVNTLKADMNERRIAVVKHAFQIIDQEGKKAVTLSQLQQMYNAPAHPRVRTR